MERHVTEHPTLCDARIRPFPNAVTVMCEDDADHGGHHGGTLLDYAYPGSKTVISWAETDRRTFRGDWTDCQSAGCILPNGHHGRHAT